LSKQFGFMTNRRQTRPLIFVGLVLMVAILTLLLSACQVEVNTMSMASTTPSPVALVYSQVQETPLVLPPTATATPFPTSTPLPTATPYPTSTPVPTATPTPTATLIPTSTPKPTATPYPTATAVSTSTAFPTTRSQPSATAASFETSLLNKAADNLGALSTLHFILEIRQGKVTLSGADLKRAEGDLKRPDGYQASVKLKILFGEVTVKVVGQNGVQQMTDPITGKWSKSGASETLNLAEMLDPSTGVGSVLKNLQNVTLVGSELLNGTTVYHVQGLASAAQAGQLTFHNLGQNEATVDAWVGQDDSLLRQLYLKENSPGNGFWAINFSNFNQPVEISQK
jgi:hypothetical protein